MSLTVVIGGTRSGKSAHAEKLAAATGLPVRYVATADASDESMAARIATHAARRPPEWTTVEAGASLADAVTGGAGECVLVDGLGPWIATRLFREDADVPAEIERAAVALGDAGAAIVVAEQAGEGVLPADAESRAWLDLLGEATQRLARDADDVVLVVAGRPLTIACKKGDGPFTCNPNLRHHGDRDVRPGDTDHAVNVVAGGAPAWLRTALAEAPLDRYPNEDDAVTAIAAHHGCAPEQIVPTNGAAEALWLLGPAFRPRLAACVYPAFTETEAGLHAHGVDVVRVFRDPERGFALDPSQVPDDADLVVVGNPASPSGTLDPAAAILALRRPGRVVVVDEAFMSLVPGEPGSLVGDDVVVVRSLTKALGVPGLRVGYAVAPLALAERLRAVRPPWSANALALAALVAAAAHPGELAAIAEHAADERRDLEARLSGVVRIWPGAANFVLIEVPDGRRVVAELRAQRIAVRPAASFPGLDDRHIRITARDPESNTRIAELVAAAVGTPA